LVCFVNQTHAVLYSYCSLITKQITLMSRLFLANQTHTVQPEKSNSWTNVSSEWVLFSEPNTYCATTVL